MFVDNILRDPLLSFVIVSHYLFNRNWHLVAPSREYVYQLLASFFFYQMVLPLCLMGGVAAC